MPVDLEGRFKRLLKEIITISSGIRNSALDHANDQNFGISEKFRRQLETIRVSADAILEAFAKATLTSYTLDDRITDWLMNREPRLCLDKLKELEDMLRPVERAPGQPTENKLVTATNFLEKNNTSFRFLLTPDHWNSDQPIHPMPQAPQVAQNSVNAATEHEACPLSDTDQTGPKREFIRQKLDEISRWLAPLECAKKHTDALRLRQEGTCKWFSHTDAYKTWRAPGNRFLWLHGKAGCGKSVLIASTIEHLKTGLGQEEVVVFFYCDFQNKRSTSSTELMRSLLSQLLRHLRDRGVDPGDFPEKILKQKSQGTLSLDDLEKLCGLCADIEALLPALVTLSQSDVRLLVTSRPDQTIMDHFVRLRSLSFEDVNEAVAADIALHVRREVGLHNRLRSAVPELKDEIDVKLIGKAEGRFRWVQCQLDTLKRCGTREELSEALDSLPNELGATYERILGMIDERKSEGELARRVLALLMVAIEPLQLVQIIDGLAIDFQKRKHDHKARQWLETKLLHSLSSLVLYHEESDVLTLSHYSVKEYLTGRSALPMYQIVVHQAHAEVAQMCMGYISIYLKQESPRDDLKCFPMMFYVLSFGFNHLAHVDSESSVALEALQSLGSDFRGHPSHWDRLCDTREKILEWPYVPWPSSKHDFALYILIAYSSPGLLRTFLYSNHPLHPRIRTNPLVYAADLRKTEHAMVLLAHGADMDARGLVTDGSYSASPLQIAIDLGDDVLVGELLRRGCLMASELLSTAVCMPWCSTRVLAKLMETDEFAEWALEIGEEKLYRSVFSSARPDSGDSKRTEEDHLVLARRLRQFGFDLSTQSRFGRGMIERALHAAHTSMLEFLLPPDQPPPAEFLLAASTGDTSETIPVIRFLLQKGVDVHAISEYSGDTALHLAAMCPWEPRSLELTRLLIDAGCDPHVLNDEEETSMVVAIRHGHCSVVKLLLSCRVPLPPDILHTALRRRQNSRMIQFLLRSGADANIVARFTRNSILHSAIIGPESVLDEDEDEDIERQESECFNFVKCFLKAGCDPTVRNCSGKTAMELAIECDFTSVVEHLLSSGVPLPPNILPSAMLQDCALKTVECLIRNGADVHSATSYGNTVLDHILGQYRDADEERYCSLVKALIDTGCDMIARNSTGEIALNIAIQRDFTSVVELLLSSGVPLPPDVLLNAIQDDCHFTTLECLIRNGANVHSTTSDGDTVLHLILDQCDADEEGYCQFVKALTNAGCDTTARDSAGMTPLEIAVDHNLVSVVKHLLSLDIPLPPDILWTVVRREWVSEAFGLFIQRGADVHFTTSHGDTILHLALTTDHTEEEHYELAKTLINAGCDAAAHNSTGKTALEIAMEHKLTSVVELLLSLEVPLPPDVLLVAVRHNCTPDMVERLIQKGVDLCAITPDGDTVLHLAMNYSEEKCRELVKRLINASCDTSARGSAGKTALEAAIECSFTSVVELLLPPDTPLPPDILLVAVGSTLEMIEYLIQRGADVHVTTSRRDNVLHLTLRSRNYGEETCCKLVRRLVDAGCDTAARDSTGQTALEIAMNCSFPSVVELLLPSDVPLPPDVLLIVVWQGSTLEIVEYLIQRGADVHSSTSYGDTILHLALSCRNYGEDSEERCRKLVKRLVAAGCDTTARGSTGQTVLEIAMNRSFQSVVELLLPFRVPLPPDILLTAVRQGSNLAMFEYLIQRGANVHSTTSRGDTSLHLALSSRNYGEKRCCKLMKRLVEAGCNTAARGSAGKTVLEIAIERSFTSVVEVLLLSDVPLPPDALLIAVWEGSTRSTPKMVEYLIQRGADVHSVTSSGDTLLHLALGWDIYDEETCCELVKVLINAGCDPTALDSTGNTTLEMAMLRNLTSVVELLLSFNVSIPLSRTASWRYGGLVHKGGNHLLQNVSGANWDTLLQLSHTSYTGESGKQVTEILKAARKGCRTRSPIFDDETHMRVTKKSRLVL